MSGFDDEGWSQEDCAVDVVSCLHCNQHAFFDPSDTTDEDAVCAGFVLWQETDPDRMCWHCGLPLPRWEVSA